MRIRMLRDLEISFDGGRKIEKLEKGKSYDVPISVVQNLLDKKIVEEDKAIDPPKETKVKAKRTTRRKPRK